MSSVRSEKFDINECKIARQSYISYDQNYKTTYHVHAGKSLGRNTAKKPQKTKTKTKNNPKTNPKSTTQKTKPKRKTFENYWIVRI